MESRESQEREYRFKLLGLVEGEARAPILVYPYSLSIYGELDPETGAIRREGAGNPAGKILVFEKHRGSTVAPYVLYGLSLRGRAPAGLVTVSREVDPILVAAAVMSKIPLAAGLPREAIDTLRGSCTGVLRVEKGSGFLKALCY